MLNPRAHPFHQETDRLKVGDFVVDIPRREVTACDAAGEPSRLTVKALHVLLALGAQAGKVVSREALLEWVWPDTLPTDDVLTQAIGQLRKAFGDDREAPRYLETISKGGYRLVAPLQWLDTVDVQAVQETAPQPITLAAAETAASKAVHPRTGSTWLRLGVALMGLALVAAGIWYASHRQTIAPTRGTAVLATQSRTSMALPFVTITSRPGRETSPSMSPDGSMVAYVQVDEKGFSTIMLQATVHVPARALTATPANHSDVLPVWSPDGRTLAFARFDSASRCQIMLIAASGGNERKIADCFAGTASTYDWTPDGSGLLMGLEAKLPNERSSPLRLLDIASGQWTPLQYAIADGDIDIDPRYSPDGKWIVFRRSISLSDLWRMPAAGGAPQRLTQVKSDIRGWDWLPDGSGIIFSYIGNEVGMFLLDIASGSITHLGMSEHGMLPDIARNAPALAFTVDQSTSGLFRFTLPENPQGKASKQRIFPSSRSDMLPAVSPDGRTLAFISERGSRLELWVGQLDKPESIRPIPGLMPIARHLPVWSQDGSRLLVVGSQPGQQSLYEVEVESGRVHLLPVPAPSPIYAAYTADPKRLLVGSDGGNGRLRAVLYDRSQTPWRELATLQDVALVQYDARLDRFHFTRVTKPGIWTASPGLQTVQVLDPYRPRLAREYKRWTVGPDGVYFLEWAEQCATGWIRMGAPEFQPATCLDKQAEGWPLAPSQTRDGRSIFVTMDVSNNADIGFADLSSMTSGMADMRKK